MAQRQLQIYDSGIKIVHFTSVWETDRALCGQDLAGDDIDDRGVYEQAEQTTEKVDCKECIMIVEYCKYIKKHEFKKLINT